MVGNKLFPKLPRRKDISQAAYRKIMKGRMMYARYQRKLKEKARTKERKEIKKTKQREQALAKEIVRAEKANALATRRMKDIANAPSPLGIAMLHDILADKRLSAEVRAHAAALLLDIGVEGKTDKGRRRVRRDPALKETGK